VLVLGNERTCSVGENRIPVKHLRPHEAGENQTYFPVLEPPAGKREAVPIFHGLKDCPRRGDPDRFCGDLGEDLNPRSLTDVPAAGARERLDGKNHPFCDHRTTIYPNIWDNRGLVDHELVEPVPGQVGDRAVSPALNLMLDGAPQLTRGDTGPDIPDRRVQRLAGCIK
jgi:hypothetical protein